MQKYNFHKRINLFVKYKKKLRLLWVFKTTDAFEIRGHSQTTLASFWLGGGHEMTFFTYFPNFISNKIEGRGSKKPEYCAYVINEWSLID